ncbi:hypothetical protein ACG873_02480 [Mesorhizobium sp. AaZ16]|uniref:hypothetical protein n=1 Tax=Mesorhizobium sp. AaZ16 TaxID=3402289 RepID=UPI00374FA0E5
MATITYVFTINRVAKKLGEDPELLQAIVSNDDKLSYGSVIRAPGRVAARGLRHPSLVGGLAGIGATMADGVFAACLFLDFPLDSVRYGAVGRRPSRAKVVLASY